MALIEIQELIKPIPGEFPCGVDITYDEEFQSIKEKRIVPEERSLGAWKIKKSQEEQNTEGNKSVSEICTSILKTKSKNLQVVAYLIEDLVKKNNLSGLECSLEFLKNFCEEFWESFYPSSSFSDDADNLSENFIEERMKIFHWIDEKVTFALRFSLLSQGQVKEEITFDDIEKINNIGIYARKTKTDVDSSLQTKFKIFINDIQKKSLHENVLKLIENSLLYINQLGVFLSSYTEITPEFFSKCVLLLNNMKNFFSGLSQEENSINNEELQLESSDNFENANSINISTKINLNTVSRDEIYIKIGELAKRLQEVDTHSPVPHFIFKLLTWKDKSFLEIVGELGLNSPLFDFMNAASKEDDISPADEEERMRYELERRRYEDE